jgi:hypothetical protein
MGFNEEIKIKYFLGEGNESIAIILGAKKEQTLHFEKVNALVSKYGADAAWGGRAELSALAFNHDPSVTPGMKEGFLRPKIHTSDGQRYAVYYPDKRYKEGKSLARELKGVGSFNFSDCIVEKLGLTCSVFGQLDGRSVRCSTSAGCYGERIVVRLPSGGDSRPQEIAMPPFLREIKRSEFVAISEEGA